jgi:8-oxo-dGTP pyrophosphatase MutT (NUDIX family)
MPPPAVQCTRGRIAQESTQLCYAARPVPAHPTLPAGETLRHFTVAVFVVHQGRVLLHFHQKLGRWLPPGGHIEANELPDAAAVREVLEETGVLAHLVGGQGLPIDEPRQLVIPAGIQVESIYPGHEHVDLVYFAIPDPLVPESARIDPALVKRDRVGWYAPADLAALGADDEMRAWADRAVREVMSH